MGHAPAISKRESIMKNSSYWRDVDVDGYYHPKEFLRKLSREFTQLRYNVTSINDGTMRKNPVGHQTGEFDGEFMAHASSVVNPAGTYKYRDLTMFWIIFGVLLIIGVAIGVFTYGIGFVVTMALAVWIFITYGDRYDVSFTFPGQVDAKIDVYLSGEVYEDFRKETVGKVPISSNLSLLLGGRVDSQRLSAGHTYDEIITQKRGTEESSKEYLDALKWWQAKIKSDIDALAVKAETVRRELTTR